MTAPAKLTKRVVDQTSSPIDAGQAFVWDVEVKGFGLRITKAGVKSYIFQYRNGAGQVKRKTIGRHGPMTPDQAREIARDWYGEVRKGADPVADQQASKVAPTVEHLCDEYVERHAKRNKRPRSLEGDLSLIDRFIKPQIGRKKVREIESRDIERVAVSLGERRITANRVVALLSKMFNLARRWQWCDRNPTEGWQKHPETKRRRYLSTEELDRLFSAMDGHANQRACNIVRMLILTGGRSGEVFGMKWADVDLTLGRWTKLAHTTKQKRAEMIPLSEPALALLRELREIAADNEVCVFPGDVPGESVTTIKTFWRNIKREVGIEDVRPHDLRHTYASHLVSAGLSLEIIGRLLGHTQAQTTMRYAHLQDDVLRKATNQLSDAIQYRPKTPHEN